MFSRQALPCELVRKPDNQSSVICGTVPTEQVMDATQVWAAVLAWCVDRWDKQWHVYAPLNPFQANNSLCECMVTFLPSLMTSYRKIMKFKQSRSSQAPVIKNVNAVSSTIINVKQDAMEHTVTRSSTKLLWLSLSLVEDTTRLRILVNSAIFCGSGSMSADALTSINRRSGLRHSPSANWFISDRKVVLE